MRLQQNVGCCDLVLELRPRTGVPRVLMGADIVPWPSIERVFTNPGDIIGREVISKPIALVSGAPNRAVLWLDRKTHTIANSGRECLLVLPVGVEGQHRRAIVLVSPGRAERMPTTPCLKAPRRISHAFAVIAVRPYRNEHPVIARRKCNVAARMAR